MGTVAVAGQSKTVTGAVYDRAFYSGMAILMALVVFAGFAPTYYLRSFFGAPVTISGAVTLSPLALVHGAIFTTWVLLFIVQTALVARRQVAVHRRLGIGGAVLAATMIVVGTTTALAAAARGSAPPGVEPLAFLIIPLGDMVLFAGFIGSAIWRRTDREAHKRLMLLAYVSIITAAIARLPGISNPLVFFGLSLLFVVAGIVYDKLTRGRVHRVYVWGGAILALSVPARLALSETALWRAFADVIVR